MSGQGFRIGVGVEIERAEGRGRGMGVVVRLMGRCGSKARG